MFDAAGVAVLDPESLPDSDPLVWLTENLPVGDAGRPVLPPDVGPATVPADLDSWEPGPVLAAVVSTLDLSSLSAHDRVRVLRARQRLASHAQAGVYEAMAAVADSYRDEFDDVEWVEQAAAMEVAAALRLTRRSAGSELATAHDLSERLPRVGEELAAGRIDRARALVLCRETLHLPIESARAVIDQVIERAGGWTTGQLAERVRKLSIQIDPDRAADRYEVAVHQRRMVAELTTDGTANLLGLDLPSDRVAAISDRIDWIARRLKSRDDPRTMDQIRADVYLDLLSGRHHDTRGGTVHLRVDLATLAELSDDPGELAGMGPVIADIARQVAHQAGTWEYTVTHPGSGRPLSSGVTRRRPDTATTRQVTASMPTCIAPGCRMPAIRCDLDHRIAYSRGGPTDCDHLAPLCRYHHVIRHKAGWTYISLPDGDHHWTSPLGHTYTTSGRSP